MSRCPTCGQTRPDPLPETMRRSLTRLQAEYPGFSFSYYRAESGSIESTYHGKPMIGNKTVAHVKEMLAAMTEGSTK